MQKSFITLAFIALLSSGAAAFQVQESAGSKAPATKAETPALAPSGAADLKLNIPDSAAGGKSGTEIRIPGLGKLGVIPKMDFGLELLYGANQKERVEPESNDSKDGELAIRGSIRHRF